MKTRIVQPDRDSSGNIVLVQKPIENVKVSDVCIMSIDGSTTNTGVAILRQSDGALFFSCSFSRERIREKHQYSIK